MTYIIKARRGPRESATTPELKVRYPDKLRTKNVRHVEGIGSIREVEACGKIKTEFEFRFRSDDGTLRSDGQRGFRYSGLRCAATREGVNALVRRMRPQEEHEITAMDIEIAAVREALAGLRIRRDEMVREAWTKAHKVTVAEVREAAEL